MCACRGVGVGGGNWIIVLKYDLRLKGLKVVSDRPSGGGFSLTFSEATWLQQ